MYDFRVQEEWLLNNVVDIMNDNKRLKCKNVVDIMNDNTSLKS